MDKYKVEAYLNPAYIALNLDYVLEDGTFRFTDNSNRIERAYRSQISSFGAAIIMGNLTTAIAFFSKKGNASVRRDALMHAIYKILQPNGTEKLYDYVVKNNTNQIKEDVINAAIALKLAMNLYELTDKNE